MTVQTKKYVRKSFEIDAVKVTEENMSDVAAWCHGEIKTALNGQGKKFIQVNVRNPINDRQGQAFIGDWVLYNKSGYKVFTDRAFKSSFDLDTSAELDSESEALARGLRRENWPTERAELEA